MFTLGLHVQIVFPAASYMTWVVNYSLFWIIPCKANVYIHIITISHADVKVRPIFETKGTPLTEQQPQSQAQWASTQQHPLTEEQKLQGQAQGPRLAHACASIAMEPRPNDFHIVPFITCRNPLDTHDLMTHGSNTLANILNMVIVLQHDLV